MIEIINDIVPTNADRIRSMNDGELAKFITSILCSSIHVNDKSGFFACKAMNGNLCNWIRDNKPNEDIVKWLQETGR